MRCPQCWRVQDAEEDRFCSVGCEAAYALTRPEDRSPIVGQAATRCLLHGLERVFTSAFEARHVDGDTRCDRGTGVVSEGARWFAFGNTTVHDGEGRPHPHPANAAGFDINPHTDTVYYTFNRLCAAFLQKEVGLVPEHVARVLWFAAIDIERCAPSREASERHARVSEELVAARLGWVRAGCA